MRPLKTPTKFQALEFCFFFNPLDVVCSLNHVLGDGLPTPSPPTKFLNMFLCEQLLQVFDIGCKGKCPIHFSKGVPIVLSFGIVATNSIPIVGFFQILPTKKNQKKK
jgi:hypothetical protein